MIRILTIVSVVLFSQSCSSVKRATLVPVNIKSLKYLGGYEIPFDLQYKNTIVGGLSGIDYDAGNNLYYLISDDRSEKNPARFYKAKIFISQSGIDSLRFIDVVNILQPDGKNYPGYEQDRFNTPDPEAIRYNPRTRHLVWSSEGERIVRPADTVLIDPSVLIMNKKGKYIRRFELPANLKMQTTSKGPRRNGTLEGLCFAENYKTMYVNVEEPLFEDGPRADIIENNAVIRIIKYDVKTEKTVAQYGYKLEPVAHAAIPETEFRINGVTDILSLGNDRLLILERSFSTGIIACTIKVFITDLNGASDISLLTLKDNPYYKTVSKKLLLNMDDLGIYTDNIEGMTFGPVLPNGHKTLLFVADNNFNEKEKAQLLLFEVLE